MIITPEKIFGTRSLDLFEFDGSWEKVYPRLGRFNEFAGPRDEWGNWDGQFESSTSLKTPLIDSAFRRTKSKSPWPKHRPFALSLSHDIDTLDPYGFPEYWVRFQRQKNLGRFKLIPGYLKNKLLKESRRWNFKSWLDAEQRYGFKSTWFVFPNEPIPWSPFDCAYQWNHKTYWTQSEELELSEALKRLASMGFEVGLHASFFSASQKGLLLDQRNDLQHSINQGVISIRQHYLRFEPSLTPLLQEEAGFKIDSSVGMNRYVGFRSGTCFPHYLFDQTRCTNVLEIPLIIQEGALFGKDALNLNFAEAKKECFRVLDEVERVNGIYSVLFHPDCLFQNEKWDLYETILEECHRRGAWGTTKSEIARHWLN